MPYEFGTVIIGSAATELFSLRRYEPLKTYSFRNLGPATFVSGVIEWSPDGNAWGTLDGTTIPTLGGIAFGVINNGLEFIRARAAVASGSTATAVWHFNT